MPKGEHTGVRAKRISDHYHQKAKLAVEQATKGLTIPGKDQLLLNSNPDLRDRLDRADTCLARAGRVLGIK